MWILEINRRATGENLGAYASFETYAEACAFGNRNEMSFRRAGQYWTVRWMEPDYLPWERK